MKLRLETILNMTFFFTSLADASSANKGFWQIAESLCS